MQLSCVLCLKPGEIYILISWPLAPNSKTVTFLYCLIVVVASRSLNFVTASIYFTKKFSVNFCSFFFIDLGIYFNSVLDFDFFY